MNIDTEHSQFLVTSNLPTPDSWQGLLFFGGWFFNFLGWTKRDIHFPQPMGGWMYIVPDRDMSFFRA